MSYSEAPICLGCQHFERVLTSKDQGRHRSDGNTLYTGFCTAFPERIPYSIWRNETDHRLPVTGDNGIRFRPNDYDAERYASEVFGPIDSEGRDGQGLSARHNA